MSVTVTFEALESLLQAVFLSLGCSKQACRVLASNCAGAERDGRSSHGTLRMAEYVATLESGWVDGSVEPAIEDAAPGFLRVDARNGFAPVALDCVRDEAMARAKANGIAIVAVRRSHHLGALYLDVEPYAEQGYVALSVVNSMAVVAPHAFSRPVYGTNPLAFASPVEGLAPLVFDQSSSSMAHVDVRRAATEGRLVPENAGIDRHGRPTTDPAAIVAGGALLPFGAHKGMMIALMVEILCAALGGGQFSHEVEWMKHPGACTPCTGQTLIVIDPRAGDQDLVPLARRVRSLIDVLLAAGQSRMPGRDRIAARARALAEGIQVPRDQWAALQRLLERGVPVPGMEGQHRRPIQSRYT